MIEIEFLDRPPPGWFVLDVIPIKLDGQDWAALMVDADPDRKMCVGGRGPWSRECWVAITGKHGSREDACEALEEMMATRH